MNDWIEIKLTELGMLGRGKSKHRPRDASHLYNGNYPFIQTGDIKASPGRWPGGSARPGGRPSGGSRWRC